MGVGGEGLEVALGLLEARERGSKWSRVSSGESQGSLGRLVVGLEKMEVSRRSVGVSVRVKSTGVQWEFAGHK